MSEGSPAVWGYSTYEVRVRAVRAVVNDNVTVMEAARAFGTDRTNLHRWLARYRADGQRGLERRPVPGRPRRMADVDSKALAAIVMAPASTCGFETDFWTTPRLIQVVAQQFGVTVSKQTMMRRLHEAGLTYQKPERQYFDVSV
jgi:transposase